MDEIFNDLFSLQLKELYVLLTENYVEDDDNMFRFDYSPEFLRWALMPPEYLKEWHTGTVYIYIRTVSSLPLLQANLPEAFILTSTKPQY